MPVPFYRVSTSRLEMRCSRPLSCCSGEFWSSVHEFSFLVLVLLGASVVFLSVVRIAFTFILVFLWHSDVQVFVLRLTFVCQGCDLVPFSCCSYPFLASHWMGLNSGQVDYYRGQTSSNLEDPALKGSALGEVLKAAGCLSPWWWDAGKLGLSHHCHLPLWVVSLLQSRDWNEREEDVVHWQRTDSLSSRPSELLLDLEKCGSSSMCVPTDLIQWLIHDGRQPGWP